VVASSPLTDREPSRGSMLADSLPILSWMDPMVTMPYHHMFEFGAVAVLALILFARIMMR
jgi:hypothetical protein